MKNNTTNRTSCPQGSLFSRIGGDMNFDEYEEWTVRSGEGKEGKFMLQVFECDLLNILILI